MRIHIKALMNGTDILSGAGPGRQLLTRMIEASPQARDVTTVLLDFSGVQIATSSFLRESVIAYRDYARQSLSHLYPVLANASDAVLEELNFFIRHRGDAIWHCVVSDSGSVSNSTIIGELDPAQRETFEIVRRVRKTSAPELASQNADIGQTAWNNRLSWLSTKGLIAEHRVGKTKVFTPLLEVS